MGVGRPEDFVTLVNRFPPHGQWFTGAPNACFVTISARASQFTPRDLVAALPNYPLKTFSGKQAPSPDTKAVFFCFRIPRPDPNTLDPSSGEPAWTESAGDTVLRGACRTVRRLGMGCRVG